MHLSRHARIFVTTTICAGTLVLGSSLQHLFAAGAVGNALILIALAAVTGTCMIKVPRTDTRFSLSDTLVFASALLIGPSSAAVVAAVDGVAATIRFNRGDTLYCSRLLFNAAAAATSVWLPGQAFLALGGQPALAGGSIELESVALPLFTLVAGYSILNTGAVAAVLALRARVPLTTVWRENFAWIWVAHAWSGLFAFALSSYVPHVNVLSFAAILSVGLVGYATVRLYLGKVEESTERLHKLNDLYLATIRSLALAIDAKDQVTHGHIRRVQTYAVGLAQALGVTDEAELKGIEAGALLHDTGKIAVPEHILNKPGKLTPQEYERIKTHVTIGAEILSGIEFPYPVLPIVRHHHENWDGTGYPDGLRGEDIPLGARILSVADCFDALTSDRPYRRALSPDVAIRILRERSGTMYEPRVVETFIRIHPAVSARIAAQERVEGLAPVDTVPARDTSAGQSTTPEVALAPRPGGSAALPELPRVWSVGLTTEEIGLLLLHRLQQRLPFHTGAVYVTGPASEQMVALTVAGPHAQIFRQSTIPLGEGLSGWVAAHGQVIVNGNPALDTIGPAAEQRLAVSSALVVPFADEQGGRGALALYAEAPDAFTLAHATIASEGATQLGAVLRTAASNGTATAEPGGRSRDIEMIVAMTGELGSVTSLRALRDLLASCRKTILGGRQIAVVCAADAGWEIVAGPPDALDNVGAYAWKFLVDDGTTVGMLGIEQRDAGSSSPISEAAVNILATVAQSVLTLERVKQESVRDTLTGCCTRGHAMETLAEGLRRAHRSGSPLSVLMIDLDEYKLVNDRFGHVPGDAVLAAVAAQLRRILRGTDLVGRIGGDEFLVVMPNTPLDEAIRLAEAIRQAVEDLEVPTVRGSLRITASIGVAETTGHESTDVAVFVDRADVALYRAKEAGRNCVRACAAPGRQPARVLSPAVA